MEMNIREKYNLEKTADYLLFQPLKPLQLLSQWFLAGIFVCGILLPFFRVYLNDVWFYSLYVLCGYGIVHSLYDIFIRAKIKYTFDLRENSVYRESPLSAKKKILKLDEAVIFVSSEMGSWHYSIGARKSQFIKSYILSENFSSGKKSDRNQAAYENHILAEIKKMTDSVQTV